MAITLGTGPKGKRVRPVPVVNVTPLVDVALVVLIILMTVTPMMMKQFYLHLPKQDKNEEKAPPNPNEADGPLVMTVDKNGGVKINQTVIPTQDLKQRLPRMLAAKTHKVLYFDAHDDLEYAKAVSLLDLSRMSGAKSIAILTQKVAQ